MRFRKTCRQCGKSFEGDNRETVAQFEACDRCRIALPDSIEVLEEEGNQDSGTPFESHSTQPESDSQKAADEVRKFELRWAGTDLASKLPAPLPDSPLGGFVGRLEGTMIATVDLPTISRKQFAFKYLEDNSGIMVTNCSQFGTWVNGRLLSEGESCAAPVGSVLEMGGFTFELAVTGE